MVTLTTEPLNVISLFNPAMNRARSLLGVVINS